MADQLKQTTVDQAAGVTAVKVRYQDMGDGTHAEVVAASTASGSGGATAANQTSQIIQETAAATSLAVIDDWDESDRAKVNPIAGQAGVQGGSGAVTALTQRQVSANAQAIVLLASAARTTTSAGATAVSGLGSYGSIMFQLDLTAAATDVDDTLDVFVQTTIDGTNWLDVVHFTQALGNGGAKRFIAKLSKSAAETMYEVGTALGAAAVRNIMGDQYRVRYDIADPTGTNASFTFSVTANALA